MELFRQWKKARQQRASLARGDVNEFCAFVGKDAETGERIVQEPVHERFQAMADENRRLILMAHPESGKSTQIGVLRVLYLLGRNPNLRIAIVSKTAENAAKSTRAIKSYQSAIKIDPAHLRSYNNLGIALTDAGQAKKAVKILRRATAIDPGYTKAWISLGLAYHALEQYPKAALTFKRAIETNPESADAYTNLGNAYAVQGLYPEAVEAYRRSLQLDGDDPNTHFNLGSTYARMGRTSDAALEVETLEILDPRKAESLRRRIDLGAPL